MAKGRWSYVRHIGAGGMGEVYKACDLRLDRTIAIKVLPPGKVTDPARQQRFVQEAKAAGLLNRPNIVTIYDICSPGELRPHHPFREFSV